MPAAQALIDHAGRAALLGALAFAAGSAQAYAEFGYYSGAWAATFSGNCVGDGTNPYGGCTPGTFPLAYAAAQQQDGAGRTASATADLAAARLYGTTVIVGPSNGSGAAANFMDTITIVGALPTAVQINFTMRVDSTFAIGSDWGQDDIQANLSTGAGTVASYIRTTPAGSCYWPIYGGAECTASDGWDTHSITRSVTVSDANRSFMLGATLYVGGWSMNTDAQLQLSLQLPAGLSFTSASGVFATAAVPESSPAILLLLGLGVFAHRVARARAASVAA